MAKIILAELALDEKAFLTAAKNTQKAILELAKTQKLLKKNGKENSEQFVKNEIQLKKLRSEYLNQKKAIIALESPYAKLSNRLIRARKEFKDLAATQGISNKQLTEANAKVIALDRQLKRIDKSVGQSQRNVGNYGNAWQRLKLRITGVNTTTQKTGGILQGLSARFLGLTAVIFGAVRALKDMFNRVRTFDKAMVGLSAILGENRDQLKELEIEIINVAGASIKTSNEVAELATVLVTLGKTKTEVIQLLKPVNDLAIGLQASSQEAGELLIQTLNAFGKSGDSAQEYADIIAKMRTSTALDFERIKDSLGFLAPVAKVAGISFENTAAILGVLVDNGIKAAKAGRLTASSFLRLAAKGLTLEEALDKVNEAQEKGVTNTELLALATRLFGVNAGAVGLILANNRDRVAELTEEFENAAGTLDNLTKKQLESLDAKLLILDSAWERFVISVENGDGALGTFFKNIIVGTTDLINLLGLLNEDFGTRKIREGNIAMEGAIKLQEQLIESRKELNDELVGKGISPLNIDELTREDLDRVQKKIEDTTFVLNSFKEILAEKAPDDILGIESIQTAILKFNRTLNAELGKQQVLQQELGIETQKELEARLEAEQKAIEKAGEDKKREKEKSEAEKKKEAEKIKAQEKQDLATFEQEKINLLNEIEIAKLETDRAKAEEKSVQRKEAEELEVEELLISKEQKNELLRLLEDAHLERLFDIRDIAREKEAETRLKAQEALNKELIKQQQDFNKQTIRAEQILANSKNTIIRAGVSALKSILGDSVLFRLAELFFRAKKEVASIQIASSAAQLKNYANAVASAPFPLNLPFIGGALAQNVVLSGAAKAAQAKVITAAAISGLGAIGGSFYEGGQVEVPSGIGGKISGQNIPTQRGGDNIVATLKDGEAVLTPKQQERAGGDAFFKSIGVPGFQDGGIVGVPSTTLPTTTQSLNTAEFAEILADRINDIKIVAIEEEISEAIATRVEIVDGADI